MDRRDALKSLAAFAGATGLSVTPVTTQEAADVALVILKSARKMSRTQQEGLAACWTLACKGTALEHVRVLVFDDGLSVELVRAREGRGPAVEPTLWGKPI